MRSLRGVLAVLGAVGLLLFLAASASAQDPKPGQFVYACDNPANSHGESCAAPFHLIRSSSPGDTYTHPPSSYAPGATFSYGFELDNTGVPPTYSDKSTAVDNFHWGIFKLGLDATKDYTEAQLEAMVHSGHDGGEVQVFESGPQPMSLPNATNVPVTESTTLTASTFSCGYFQFDFGLINQTLKPGNGNTLNSGFLRVSGCAAAVSGTTTTTTGVSGTTATLASTGGSPLGNPLIALALLLTGLAFVTLGIRVRQRRV
jgi:hypothetical protein